MKCPKCADEMAEVMFGTVVVDRCQSCAGIWFDSRERELLLKAPGAEKIDTGDASLGRKYNRVDRVNCPRCTTPLVRMVHPTQTHIFFELCSVCGGSFLDAGEFRDMKSESLGDFFRSLFGKSRNY